MKPCPDKQPPTSAHDRSAAALVSDAEAMALVKSIREMELELSAVENALTTAVSDFEIIRQDFMLQLDKIQKAEENSTELKLKVREYQSATFGRKNL